MRVRATGENILANFIEKGEQKTAAGIVIPDDNAKDRGIRPRWCQVYDVGPRAKKYGVEIGNWILIEHGRWTLAENVGELDIRKIDPDAMLLISDERPEDIMG